MKIELEIWEIRGMQILENKLTAIQTQITNIQQQLDGTKPFTSDLDMGNNRIIKLATQETQNIISSMRMMQSQPNFFTIMLKSLTKNSWKQMKT